MGAWFGLGVAAGIFAGNSVVPLGPGPAALVAAGAAGAAIGNVGAWVLVPPCLGLWRVAVTDAAFRRLVVTVPQRCEGTFEVLAEEGRGVVVRAGERRLLLSEPPPEVARPGVRFRALLRADPVRAIADPSAFRADAWARTRGIHGRARILGNVGPIDDATGVSASLRRIAHRFRSGARSRLGAGRSDPGSLVTALLLGDRRGLGTDERRDFRRAGLAHVLALSGMHVGVLALGTGALLRALRLRGWPVLGSVLLFLVVFSFVTGGRSPILRAATTSGLAAIGLAVGRRFPPVHAVGLVAGILLLRDPSGLTDVGFRLSFTAAGLLALAASRPGGIRRRGWRGVIAGTGEAIGLSAVLTLGTLPDQATAMAPNRKPHEADAPKVGISVQVLTPELADQLGYPNKGGLVITAVEPGSPAAEAGVESGSLILAINRKKVRTLSELRDEMAEDAKDGSVLLRLRQNGNAMFVVIHLKK